MSIELPMLIKKALVYGIKIYPYQLHTIMSLYETLKIPDDILAKMNSDEVTKYVQALHLSGQEMAGDWTRGHKLLGELGFVKREREEGHRVFVTMVYEGD